jgi:hypothetical protein
LLASLSGIYARNASFEGEAPAALLMEGATRAPIIAERKEGVMVKFELNDDEVQLLSDTLEVYLAHMQLEIARTDRKSYRDALKKRAAFLAGLLARLKPA